MHAYLAFMVGTGVFHETWQETRVLVLFQQLFLQFNLLCMLLFGVENTALVGFLVKDDSHESGFLFEHVPVLSFLGVFCELAGGAHCRAVHHLLLPLLLVLGELGHLDLPADLAFLLALPFVSQLLPHVRHLSLLFPL